MTEYNPDDLNDEAEGNVDIDFGGTIVDIEEGTAADFIRDSEGNVRAQNPDRGAIEVTVDTEADTTITEVYSLPNEDNPAMSWRNPNFKLGKFRERYGSVPEVGMDVSITVDDNGFLAIEL